MFWSKSKPDLKSAKGGQHFVCSYGSRVVRDVGDFVAFAVYLVLFVLVTRMNTKAPSALTKRAAVGVTVVFNIVAAFLISWRSYCDSRQDGRTVVRAFGRAYELGFVGI